MRWPFLDCSSQHGKKKEKKMKSKEARKDPYSDSTYRRIPDGAHLSNQTTTKTYDDPYFEANRKEDREQDPYHSHGKRMSDPQGVMASKRPPEHSSDSSTSHIYDRSHRNASESYPTLPPRGYAGSQPPVSQSWTPSQQPTTVQQPTTAQQLVPYQGCIGPQQLHPTRQRPDFPQQLHPNPYASHGTPLNYGIAQHQVLPLPNMYPYPYQTSPSYPYPQQNIWVQGHSVPQLQAAHQIPTSPQMQGTHPYPQLLQYGPNHWQRHHRSNSLRRSSSEPPRLPPTTVRPSMVQGLEAYPQEPRGRFRESQVYELREKKTELHISKSQKHQSSNEPEEQLPLDPSQQNANHFSHALATGSEIPALALAGNPGAGKSTILNGVADRVVFPAGISLGSGLTTSLKEHVRNGVSLYDTPGLADVERKKQAGDELDALLSMRIPLKIAFVVTLERGRVRPEDALTIELILDSIKINTDDQFGVVINRVTKRVGQEIEASSEKEAKIRCSLTGRHRTCHWCYVSLKEDLEDENDGKLMTPALHEFLSKLPVTKPKDVRTVPIDTDSMEEKLEKHMELIREIEAQNTEELRRMTAELMLQKEKYAAQESQFLRDEEHFVNEIQRLKEEAAATKEAREKAEREARDRRGDHRGGQHESGRRSRHDSGRRSQHESGRTSHNESGRTSHHERGRPNYYDSGGRSHQEAGRPNHHEHGHPAHYGPELPSHRESGRPSYHESGRTSHYDPGHPNRRESGRPSPHEASLHSHHGSGRHNHHREDRGSGHRHNTSAKNHIAPHESAPLLASGTGNDDGVRTRYDAGRDDYRRTHDGGVAPVVDRIEGEGFGEHAGSGEYHYGNASERRTKHQR